MPCSSGLSGEPGPAPGPETRVPQKAQGSHSSRCLLPLEGSSFSRTRCPAPGGLCIQQDFLEEVPCPAEAQRVSGGEVEILRWGSLGAWWGLCLDQRPAPLHGEPRPL